MGAAARLWLSRPMILALIVAVLACLVALVRGGSLDNLASTHLRWSLLLFGALMVQIVVDLSDPPWLGDGAGFLIMLATNAAVIAFLALNRQLPGMALAALGLLLNLIVIVANGAMPVSAWAAEVVGLSEQLQDPGVKHEVLDSQTLFPFLGDIIPIPGLSKIVSVGDVVLAAGIGLLVYRRSLEEQEAPIGAPVSG